MMVAAAQPATRCVLIVDDHADVRETLAEILAEEGYPVATAGNGQQALDYLRSHPAPGLIVLDLMMPVMNGWEFRTQQRGDPTFAAIPVAIVSGADGTEQRSSSLEAVGYFVKPVNLDGLVKLVRRYCS